MPCLRPPTKVTPRSESIYSLGQENMEHMKDDVDVLVVGGGTAGTIAAIQGGRAGLRTALVESGS